MLKIAISITGIFISVSSLAVMNGRPADPVLSAQSVMIHPELAERMCTGVVVDAHLILSAGHCTDGMEDRNVKMDISTGSRQFSVRVARWGVAPGYSSSDSKTMADVQSDIAYFVVRDDLIQALGLSPDQIPQIVTSVFDLRAALLKGQALGYGFGLYSHSSSGEKRELGMQITEFAGLSALRAVSTEPGIGVCEGDSGGGAFLKIPGQNRLLLLGVLSGNFAPNGCGSDGSYGAYASLYPMICWIQKSSGVTLSNVVCN